ncbi:MAG: complex I subunit 4 family protein [Chthoniobacterales bacterium]
MAHLIAGLIFLPVLGALFVSVTPQRSARAVALGTTFATALCAFMLWRGFDPATAGLQMAVRHAWIPAIGAELHFGLDGLSLLLVLLTSLVFPFALCAKKMGRGFYALLLVMQAALYGTFTAQNFVLWFLFYEMSLLPAFLLIRVWGGAGRGRAATKFFLYTFLGSVALLLSFLGIYLARGTFDFAELASLGKSGLLTGNARWFAFGGIFLGLAVKVPLFPFHTWLPDAYEAAPTGAAMVLTGVLSKMGVYGFIRLLLPLFPNEVRTLGPWLLGLAVCSIVLPALAAWAQRDLKRMIAYLSINHLGYCLLGLFAVTATRTVPPQEAEAALSGVFLQIFNHGLTASALFYFAGLLEQRRGARGLGDFGGLMQTAPLLCGWMSVAMFSLLGLPGLNGFVGEFLIFKGAFALVPIFSAIAVLGLLFTAITLLRAMQLLFSGPLPEGGGIFPDLRLGEKWIVVPVALVLFVLGIYPQLLLSFLNATVTQMARLLG